MEENPRWARCGIAMNRGGKKISPIYFWPAVIYLNMPSKLCEVYQSVPAGMFVLLIAIN